MTVIAANHSVIVSDSKVINETKGDDRVFNSPKLYEKNGDFIGCAGTSAHCDEFVKWYGSKKKKPRFPLGEFEALVLTKKGELVHYDELLACGKVNDEFMAVGSGGHAALGAMHMGADPVLAVEIACKVDNACGGPVQVLRLKRE